MVLDRERATWLLYRLDCRGRFVLHSAPAGEADASPPSAPRDLRGQRRDGRVELEWSASLDSESVVGQYCVRYGEANAEETLLTRWLGASDVSECSVAAVNLHGLERASSTVALREVAQRQ